MVTVPTVSQLSHPVFCSSKMYFVVLSTEYILELPKKIGCEIVGIVTVKTWIEPPGLS